MRSEPVRIASKPRLWRSLCAGIVPGIFALLLAGLFDFGSVMAASGIRPGLRVGTSGDYAPFSMDRGARSGFDITLATAWARERNRDLDFVRFRWPDLLHDLAADRFDVAMSGITVRPERSIAGRFSVPVAETGAVLLVGEGRAWSEAARANQKGIRIAVNAGGHLERVARAHFPEATVIAIPDNAAVLAVLRNGDADAVVTDTLEAPVWLARSAGLRALGPFTLDRKAALLPVERANLASELDRWLLAREADGSLARWRREAFGKAADRMPRTATPLRALLAAVDERLALMPEVAIAKQQAGLATEVPERERLVLEAAALGVERAARMRGGRRPSPAALRSFFRAQIEAAKQVQRATLEAGPRVSQRSPASLDEQLRPALLRIGERIADLILTLPANLSLEEVSTETARELRAERLSSRARDEIARAIVDLSVDSLAVVPNPQAAEGSPQP